MVSFIVITSGVVAIVCSFWVIYTKSHREEYTREKYAFRCLSACVSLVTLLIVAVLPKEGLFDHVLTLIAVVTGNSRPPADPAPYSEKALLAVVVMIAVYWIFQSHKNWEGRTSVDEAEARRLHRLPSLIPQGVKEGLRLIKREPEPEVTPSNKRIRGEITSPPQPQIIWHEYARELFELYYAKCSFNLYDETAWDSL